jgi:hypothetical protein
VVLQFGGRAWGQQQLALKYKLVTKYHKGPQTWTDSLDKRLKIKKMDMRFGTWNVRSLYRSGLLMIVVKELSRYRFNGSAGGQMGQRWHQTSRWIYIFLWKGE